MFIKYLAKSYQYFRYYMTEFSQLSTCLVNSIFLLQLKDLFLIRNTIPIIPPTKITDKITINTISKVLKVGFGSGRFGGLVG